MAFYSAVLSRGMRVGGATDNVSHIFGQILQIMDLEPDHNFNDNEKMMYDIREVELTDDQVAYIRGKMEGEQLVFKKYKVKQSAWPSPAWDALHIFQLVTIDNVNYSDGRNGAAPQLDNSNVEEIV